MARTIEVIFEDNVFKPIHPVVGINEHERVLVIISHPADKNGLRQLAGTLSRDEAKEMMDLIDMECGTIEGNW